MPVETLSNSPAPATKSPAKLAFIPAIDGLRGIAVLAVLLFHLNIAKASLGWTGVELFFVISGFLITRILLNTRHLPDYFRKFYLRRTLRIFPIYYLVLIAYTLVAPFSGGGGLRTLPFYYFYLQTFPQLQSQFADNAMLGHTWTLAIEEQFYMLWPLVVFLVKGRKLLATAAALTAAGLALRYFAQGFGNPFLIDGWLGVQVDALAAGAIVAYSFNVFDPRKVRRWLTAVFFTGAAGLAFLLMYAGTAPFWTPRIWGREWYGPLLITILCCLFSGAVGLSAAGHGWTRWLEFHPLRRWGKISYGVYLYHPYVFDLVERARPLLNPRSHVAWIGLILAKLLATYLAAALSWRLIELPFSRWKDRLAAQPAT